MVFTFCIWSILRLRAGMVDGFMSYPTYYIIGRSDKWHDYRNALNQLVGAPLAGPALLLPIISLPVIWLRPSAVPKIAVIISVLLIWTSEILTVKLVWPIHGQLIKVYRCRLQSIG